jgi:hypothetical protein
MSEPSQQDKPFAISKWVAREVYQRVKANKGAAGVDDVSIAEFEQDRDKHLYRIWNRMSSGSRAAALLKCSSSESVRKIAMSHRATAAPLVRKHID